MTRVVGDVNPDGTLVNPAGLIQNGVVGQYAYIQAGLGGFMYPNASITVTFNGFSIGGPNVVSTVQGWWDNEAIDPSSLVSGVAGGGCYQVPIQYVHFAKRNPGGAPTPGVNTVTVTVTTIPGRFYTVRYPSPMAGCDDCSLSYGAGALSIQAMSPIILVHGIFSTGSWFETNQFTTPFDTAGVPYATADFEPGTIEESGMALVSVIPRLAQEFGVSKVHIVAHSKGGIWSRYFLANGPISTDTYAPPTPNNFGVLSLITLDTPNNGSILASFVTGSIDVASLLTMEAGPEASVVLAVVLQLASGYLDQITDLTRDAVESENSELNAPPDSFEDTDGTVYYIFYGAVAADADIGDKQDTSGNRYVDSTDCAGMWALGFPLNVNVCKALYWLMGNEDVFYLTPPQASLPGCPSSSPTFDCNDMVVTQRSAMEIGFFNGSLSAPAPLFNPIRKNHSTVGDSCVSGGVSSGGSACTTGSGVLGVIQQIQQTMQH